MTSSAPGLSFNTQASNFSRGKRSTALSVTTRVSIPNCLKQSRRTFPVDSLRSTRATRAENFRLRGMAETAVSSNSSITGVVPAVKPYSGLAFRPWQRSKRPILGYKSIITSNARTALGGEQIGPCILHRQPRAKTSQRKAAHFPARISPHLQPSLFPNPSNPGRFAVAVIQLHQPEIILHRPQKIKMIVTSIYLLPLFHHVAQKYGVNMI